MPLFRVLGQPFVVLADYSDRQSQDARAPEVSDLPLSDPARGGNEWALTALGHSYRDTLPR